MSRTSIPPPAAPYSAQGTAPTPPAAIRPRSCCGGCAVAALALTFGPILALWWWWQIPVPQPQPLPATWAVGGPQLDATWSIPTSREIGFEQLTISPWLLTPEGPYFLAQDEHMVRIERWTDGTKSAEHKPNQFWPYHGTAHQGRLWFIGTDQGNTPALLGLNATTLAEEKRVLLDPALLTKEVMHGVELLPTRGPRLGFLLEPKTEAAIQKRKDGLAPARFAWLDPESGKGSAWTPLPMTVELLDYALYQRNPIPTSLSCWLALEQESGLLRLRPTQRGERSLGTVHLPSGASVADSADPLDLPGAKERTNTALGSKHFHRHWSEPLRQPPIVMSLEASGYPWARYPDTPQPIHIELLRYLQGWLEERKGGTELAMWKIVEGVKVQSLQIERVDTGMVTRITDRSLIDAVQNELPISATAPYHLVSWSETELLMLHLVVFPPPGVNQGKPILRLGLYDSMLGSLTWHGWVPFPEELQERIIELIRWRVAVYDDTLVFTMHQARNPENFPKRMYYPHVMLGARVTLPPTLRTAWYGELECTY